MTDPMRKIMALILLLGMAALGYLNAGCYLANPSFEIPGSAGAAFGGWDQFGQVGISPNAYHGFNAALVSGLSTSEPSVSGFWQQLDSSPSEQWDVSGYLMISQVFPLMGNSQALVNIEWRNSAGNLIHYDSHPVADANTPGGEYIHFSFRSAAAPAGTVALRLVLAVLQGQGDPRPEAYYDQVNCISTSSPTLDEVQWDDFPGGRSVEFSGRSWRVKGPGHYGPGPNNFSDLPSSIWVDESDRLHLTISQIGGAWNSTELALIEPLGYGDYIFTTQGALNLLDKQCVLGLFIWQYSTCWDPAASWWNPYNEIDIEYSRWGNPSNQLGQFVAQPWDWAGNIYRYDATFGATEISSHAFRWLPDRVEFRAWRGGPEDESGETLITSWTYTGPHIPRPEQARVHINLWYFGSPPVSAQEVVISQFSFVPAGSVSIDEQLSQPPYRVLRQNHPNPFKRSTEISFTLDKSDTVSLELFDIKGRKIRTLLHESKAPGSHTLSWNAVDLPAGIYLLRLSGRSFAETRKMVLLK